MIYLKEFKNAQDANNSFQEIPFVGTLNGNVAYASQPSEDDRTVKLKVSEGGNLSAYYTFKITASTNWGDPMVFSIGDGKEYTLLNDSMEFSLPKNTVIDLEFGSQHPTVEQEDGLTATYSYFVDDSSIPVVEYGQTKMTRLFYIDRNMEISLKGGKRTSLISSGGGSTDYFD